MRLLIHVHGRFHARTEPWRYEDFPAQHHAERDVKFFGSTDSVRQAGTVKQVPFCGFKMQFTHTRNISPEKENLWILWVLREKKISEWEENIFHTESTEPTELFLRNEQNICYHTGIRIHRTCRWLRRDGWRDGWRDGERMTKTLNYKTEGWQNTLNAPTTFTGKTPTGALAVWGYK